MNTGCNHGMQGLTRAVQVLKHPITYFSGLVFAIMINSCGAITEPYVEFSVVDPAQSGDLSSITATIVAKETGEQCHAQSVVTNVVIVMEDGEVISSELQLGDIEKGGEVRENVTFQVPQKTAASVETGDSSFITGNCGETGLGI